MKTKKSHLTKNLLSIILFLILAILSKSNNEYKNTIKYYLYIDSFNFNSIYNFYNKYLGGISFYNTYEKSIIPVTDEKIKYKSIKDYKKGIKLNVDKNYLVPSLKNGIVIYIGNKEEYNNVIILQTEDKINIWYSNICNTSLKLYDKISKGQYLGESCEDYIYLAYEKKGKFLNYKRYFY